MRFCLVLLLILVTVTGQAQTKQASKIDSDARVHFLAGEKAFNAKDFSLAVSEWETTLKIKPSSEYTRKMLAIAKEQRANQLKPLEPPKQHTSKLMSVKTGEDGLIYEIWTVDGETVAVPQGDDPSTAPRVPRTKLQRCLPKGAVMEYAVLRPTRRVFEVHYSTTQYEYNASAVKTPVKVQYVKFIPIWEID